MQWYIRNADRDLFPIFGDELRHKVLTQCKDVAVSYIKIHNLTDLEKIWNALPAADIENYFNTFVNIFYDYKINTANPNNVDAWVSQFVARVFMYLDEQQVFVNWNALAFDTESDRYTLTKWHSYDERHKDGVVDKVTTDNRNYDYPQYTTDVITDSSDDSGIGIDVSAIPNLTLAGAIALNEVSLAGVLTGVNIDDKKSVSGRDTGETQTVNTTSGDSDYKESWSIPKEVISYATQRFSQLKSLNGIDKDAYYQWMITLFCTFYTQSDFYV